MSSVSWRSRGQLTAHYCWTFYNQILWLACVCRNFSRNLFTNFWWNISLEKCLRLLFSSVKQLCQTNRFSGTPDATDMFSMVTVNMTGKNYSIQKDNHGEWRAECVMTRQVLLYGVVIILSINMDSVFCWQMHLDVRFSWSQPHNHNTKDTIRLLTERDLFKRGGQL